MVQSSFFFFLIHLKKKLEQHILMSEEKCQNDKILTQECSLQKLQNSLRVVHRLPSFKIKKIEYNVCCLHPRIGLVQLKTNSQRNIS